MDRVIEVPAIMQTIRTKSGTIESYRDNITFDKIQDVRTMLEDHPTCKLVIFDPLSAFWGEVNENKNAEVHMVMSQLKRIAEDYKATARKGIPVHPGFGSVKGGSFGRPERILNQSVIALRFCWVSSMSEIIWYSFNERL
jgi:hypothetical protein